MHDNVALTEPTWRVGVCSNCLIPLDQCRVTTRSTAFCSDHCRQQAMSVRYVRRSIRDGRTSDPMTRLVIYNNMITFLALDLAYTRPRLPESLRHEVLSLNEGRCVVCNIEPASEVDHIDGGSISLDNLRGLCRVCHELKPRGAIPDDLKRDPEGEVDYGPETAVLQQLWHAAIFTGLPLDATTEWTDLRAGARLFHTTRFGWITEQILCDNPVSPAHDEANWKHEWHRIKKAYREWADT